MRPSLPLLAKLLVVVSVGGCGADEGGRISTACYSPGLPYQQTGSGPNAPDFPCVPQEHALQYLAVCESHVVGGPTLGAAGGPSQCCYEVQANSGANCVVGRPLVVGHTVVHADLRSRDDWARG
jgi:hypothetical protein